MKTLIKKIEKIYDLINNLKYANTSLWYESLDDQSKEDINIIKEKLKDILVRICK